MKHQLHRLTALLLAFAMTLSLASTSLAANADISAGDSSAVSADNSTADSSAVSANTPAADSSAISTNTPAADSSADNAASSVDLDTESPEGSTKASNPVVAPSAASDSVEEAPNSDIPLEDKPEADSPEGAAPADETEEIDPLAVGTTFSWSVNSNGKYTFSYKDASGKTVAAKNGYYSLPEGSVTQSGITYTFKAGIYYFDENGYQGLKDGASSTAISRSVTTVPSDNASGISTADTLIKVSGAPTVTRSGTAVTVTSNILAVSSKVGDLYYYQGQPYTGLYRYTAGDSIRVFVMEDGVNKGYFAGKMTSDYKYICAFQEADVDNRYYFDGLPYTGLYRYKAGDNITVYKMTSGNLAGTFSGKMTSSYKYICAFQETAVDNRYYYGGYPYTGLYRYTAGDNITLYKMTNGNLDGTFSGKMTSGYKYICAFKAAAVDNRYYYNGYPYTGLYRYTAGDNITVYKMSNGNLAGTFSGKMTSGYKYICAFQEAAVDNRYYYGGYPYTGLYRYAAGTNIKLYYIENGSNPTLFTGTMSSSYTYICAFVKTAVDNRYYKDGLLFTGFSSDFYYYSNGLRSTTTGWVSVGSKRYHLTSGKADAGDASGWKYIAGPDGTTYKYKIRSDRSVVTDMFAYDRTYMSKKLLIVFSRKTTTGTILAWASDANGGKGGYVIPCKSFVISMSGENTTTDNQIVFKDGTYSINHYREWAMYSGTGYWFHYCCNIVGSHILSHTTNYKSANIRTFVPSKYNSLGGNNTAGCSRMQAVNAKLIWDLVSTASSIHVKLSHTSTSDMPFGRVTLANNFDRNGKISSSMNYDPTDPAINSSYAY